MSRTDHARPRRVPGHIAETRKLRKYDGSTVFQSVCTCGAVGDVVGESQTAYMQGVKHKHDEARMLLGGGDDVLCW